MVINDQLSDVALVSMPWAMPTFPPAGLGLVQAILQEGGISVSSYSFHVKAYDFFLLKSINKTEKSIDHNLSEIYEMLGLGETIFLVPPFKKSNSSRDDYLELPQVKKQISENTLSFAKEARNLCPNFLQECGEEILSKQPKVVGFSITFSAWQLIPSLSLASWLKEKDPSLKIVFGGNLSGPPGIAILKAYSWIDIVVQGKSEKYLVEFFKNLINCNPLKKFPGLCYRNEEGVIAIPEELAIGKSFSNLPAADFDDYFNRWKQLPNRYNATVRIPVEASRGCWWGAYQPCNFCGYSSDMHYETKDPEQLIFEMVTLAKRHRVLDFTFADAVLNPQAFETFFPKLRATNIDFRLSVLTRPTLNKKQIGELAESGVVVNHCGIENLSSQVLKQMGKGTTAIQNIRFLKWHEEVGLDIAWQFLYGIPGESEEEYLRMANWIPWLTHLAPPTELRVLILARFSKYFQNPELYGLKNKSVYDVWKYLYGLDDLLLMDLFDSYKYEYIDERNPENYIEPLRSAINGWQKVYLNDRGKLTYQRGPNYLIISDLRNHKNCRFTLNETESQIYLACDAGATPQTVSKWLLSKNLPAPELNDICNFLDAMVEEKIIFRDEGRYLSLAIPESTAAQVRNRSHA